MTTTGLAKTENDVACPTNPRGLSLVPKTVTVSQAPVRIQISEDLFTASPKKTGELRSEVGESDPIENRFQPSEVGGKCLRQPIAGAVVAGLVIGYLLGRFSK